jgi:thiamine pyrophosphokinase
MKTTKPMTVAIVAGGTLDASALSQIKKARVIIGVDRGAYWLVVHKVRVDVAIGDFDSVSRKEFQKVEQIAKNVMRFPREKDATDLELAVIHALSLHPQEIKIFGALGTRFDHTFAGMYALDMISSHNVCGYLVDKTNEIQIVRREMSLAPLTGFPYVSIFPLKERAVVTLQGFRYDVSRKAFVRGSTLGVSNELRKPRGKVIVHSGMVLLVRSRD